MISKTTLGPLGAALMFLATAAPAAASELHATAGEDGVVDAARKCDVYVAGVASAAKVEPSALRYRWREGKAVLSPWKEIRADRSAPLELCGLAVGAHALTLDVTDGRRVASDTMTATIVVGSSRGAARAER